MPYKINRQTGTTEYVNAQTGSILTPPVETKVAPAQSGGFLRTVANTLIPRTSQLLKKAKAGINLSALTDQAEEDRKKREKIINDLITRAKNEGDPNRRSQMLGQARDLAKQGSDQINEAITNFEQESGTKLNDKDRVIAEALGVAGELGTFLIPAGKFATAEQTGKIVAGKLGQKVLGSMGISSISKAKQIAEATTAAQRILKGANLGATMGAISGVTDPEAESLGERYGKGLAGAGLGFVVGGATSAVLEGTMKAAKSFLGTDKSRRSALARVFKMSPSKRAQFRKSTEGMDFEAEILAREGKNIAGMNYEQLVQHFGKQADSAEATLDEILTGSQGKVKKSSIIEGIQSVISGLSPEKGNVGTSGARSGLQSIIEDLSQFPDDAIDLSTANNIKRQLQNLGDAAFSPNGKATATSKAFANASTLLKESIEQAAQVVKGKNQVKDANRTIQLYQAAKNAIETTGDREVGKITNDYVQKFLQVIPAVAGVAGAGAGYLAGGSGGALGGAALATMLVGGAAGAARVKYLTPEIQTQMATRFMSLLEKEGVKNAGQMAVEITQSISKHLARYATLDEAPQESVEPLVTPGVSEGVSINESNQNKQQQYNGSQPSSNLQQGSQNRDVVHAQGLPQTVTIRNKKTGEKKIVSRSELRNYGLAADTPDSVPGLPTKGEILAAMVLDAQKGGKNIAKLKTILDAYDQVGEGGTAKGKTVPATQAGLLGDFDSAISLMSEVENVLSTNGKLFGPVKGAVGGANPYAVESQKADADLRRAAQIVGKAMEGGVLRKEDEIKYRKMLPKLTDTLDVANYKMNQVRDMLEKNRIQRIQALVAAGYDPETDKISGGVSTSNPLEY